MVHIRTSHKRNVCINKFKYHPVASSPDRLRQKTKDEGTQKLQINCTRSITIQSGLEYCQPWQCFAMCMEVVQPGGSYEVAHEAVGALKR